MKNVEILIKLRRLTKTLAASIIFLVLGVAGSSFKASATDEGGTKKNGKDSTQTDKYGFQSLFSNSSFDPSKPYITQLNPLAVSFVQKYIKDNGEDMERLRVWGKPYLDLYDGILAQYGLPKELKYLSVIESELKSGAASVAGALGPWQIMSDEAKRFGLKVKNGSDERKNYFKSTHAAAKILKELYGQFNDWLLVIAAYNCGAGRVRQAMRRSGSKNFWVLQSYLPLETRNHVKRFIGTHYIFEGNGGLTTMTASEIENVKLSIAENGKQQHDKLMEDNTYTKSTTISGKYNAGIIAKNIGMEIQLFNKFNPYFDKTVAAGGEYKLKLPIEKMELFTAKREVILSESLNLLLGNIARSSNP